MAFFMDNNFFSREQIFAFAIRIDRYEIFADSWLFENQKLKKYNLVENSSLLKQQHGQMHGRVIPLLLPSTRETKTMSHLHSCDVLFNIRSRVTLPFYVSHKQPRVLSTFHVRSGSRECRPVPKGYSSLFCGNCSDSFGVHVYSNHHIQN